MNAKAETTFAVSLEQAALRLDGVNSHFVTLSDMSGLPIRVAVPASYTRARRRHYPLLLLLEGSKIFGGTVEMSRLMAQTRDMRECIVVSIENAATRTSDATRASLVLEEALSWCRQHYRVSAEDCALFGEGGAGALAIDALVSAIPGVSNAIVLAPDLGHSLKLLTQRGIARSAGARRLVLLTQHPQNPLVTELNRLLADDHSIALTLAASNGEAVWGLTDLLRGLTTLWGLPRREILKFEVFRRRWLRPLFFTLSPLVRWRLRADQKPLLPLNPHRMHSAIMQRDFEVFVSMPASWSADDHRSYPAMLVLDANLQFSTASEAARSMAESGAMAEAIVIGVGAPRTEGLQEYAFRRFEEFTPPAEDYDYDDSLGEFFRGLYALRGEDARQQMGRAPEFLRFLCEEALPQLLKRYPIDAGKISLIGHSASATFSCFALLNESSLFSGYGAFSPGIDLSGHWLKRRLSKGMPLARNASKIVLSIGSEEDEPDQESGIQKTSEFSEQLRQNGGIEVSFSRFDGETHASTYPRALMKAYATLCPVTEYQRNDATPTVASSTSIKA